MASFDPCRADILDRLHRNFREHGQRVEQLGKVAALRALHDAGAQANGILPHLGGHVGARRHLGAHHAMGHRGEDMVDALPHLGACVRQQPLLNRHAGLADELLEQVVRQVEPGGDRHRQGIVVLGARHGLAEAEAGKPRAGVRRDLVRDLGVAAVDQHVGDRLVDAGAAGNRREMGLALGFRDRDELLVGEDAGLFENRSGDVDVVVVRQEADHIGGCAADRGQLAAQLDQRLPFDAVDQPAHQLVEHRDVIIRIGSRPRPETGR